MDRLSLRQAAGLHTYQQICLLFALEDLFSRFRFGRYFTAQIQMHVPESIPEDHFQNLNPSSVWMFSADLLDSDEPERYPSAVVKC